MKTKPTPRHNFIFLFFIIFSTLFPISSQLAPNPIELKDTIRDLGVEFYTNQRQITFEGPKSGEGYFSADGKKMILQSERHPNNPFYQMYVLDLKSGKVDRISPGQGKTTCGWIHPNLKKAMWSSTHLDPEWEKKQKEELETRKNPVKGKYSWSYDEQYDIFESALDGKNVKRLTKELGYDAEGSYSPNGDYIAFASNRTGYNTTLTPEDKKLFEKDPSSQMEIYIMKADGTEVRKLTDHIGYDGGPFFSADGKKITWRRFDRSGATAEIFTMNVDGSDQKQVTRINAMSWAPFYHPSGKYIIFATSVLGYSNFELFIVDNEGKQKPIRVTNNEGFDGLASFSPDGKKLTWTHRNEKGESQIYLAEWDHEKALSALQLADMEPEANFKLATAKLSKEVEVNDLKKILPYLASKKMAGRLPGSNEETELTKDISAAFKKWGLISPKTKRLENYVHHFDIVTGIDLKQKNEFFVNQKPYELNREFRPVSLSKSGTFEAKPFLFVGYGLKTSATDTLAAINDYEKLDVKDKWVVLFKDYPSQVSKELRDHLIPFSSLAHKITVAKNMGAYGVIIIDSPNLINKDKVTTMRFDGAPTALPTIEISLKVFLEIMNLTDDQYTNLKTVLEKNEPVDKIENKNIKISAAIDFELQKKIAKQVIGFVKSKNPKAKSLIVGAHMDHLGRGDVGNSLATSDDITPIHFGADDNASGMTAILELAHYFSQPQNKKKLKHNLYFALWSAEEMGVLGSKAFIEDWESENKAKFKDGFIASLNLDMVGRFKEKLQVQGVGSAQQWGRLAELISLRQQIPLSLQSDPYLPTDAISFYLAEIPSISFFTGVHSDYHTPRDTAEKINYPGLAKITQVTQQFIQEISISESTTSLTYEKVEGGVRAQGTERSFRIYLGTIPDYSQDGVKGVRISGVSKNSPAEKGGILAKDIIVEFNGKAIDSIHDYVFSLQAAEPNREVALKILRSNEVITLKVTPTLK